MTVIKKRLAMVLLKLARRLDPPPRSPRRISKDISAAILAHDERLRKEQRDYIRAQAKRRQMVGEQSLPGVNTLIQAAITEGLGKTREQVDAEYAARRTAQ